MITVMKKRSFSKAISRFYQKFKWYYDFLTINPPLFQVDLGKKS